MPHMMHLGPRWGQGGNMKQKMRLKRFGLSKEGAKREQRGSKEGVKRA